MIAVDIIAVSVRGDGLDGWPSAAPILAGAAPYVAAPARLPPPAILPPNERRRAGASVRLALAVAQEAAEASGLPPAALRSVFATGNGDGATVHTILETLAGPDRQVSPTQFHNSVHNAAAGYWSIGAGSMQPATCLGCHDGTAAAGLLAAASEACAEQQPVLLCVYDLPLPEPLNTARPSAGIFGAGLVLAPAGGTAAVARLQIGWEETPAPPDRVALFREINGLAQSNPAGRLLRLLQALAMRQPDRLALPLLDGHLDVVVQPCSTAPPSKG
ncbi:MAG: beta-ketoacyl synthase chain length factor [Proteobacteria bacterium]|nr:beta-ketoacyl synthase chain length factor [Pseudomonadota bacterium]